MTTATLTERPSPAAAPAVGRPNPTQIGTLVWLSSELMFFGGLFAMYFTLRSMAPDTFSAGQANFTHGFALLNTSILVFSSVTCQIGVFMAEGRFPWGDPFPPRKRREGSIFNIAGWGMIEWYTLTFILGAIFVSGQAFEYTELFHHGVTMSSSPFSSVFYLSTGFHGLHVIGGLIAFLMVLLRAYVADSFTSHEQVSAICVSYYWHFVDVVWIVLFFIVYMLDPIMSLGGSDHVIPVTFNWSIF
ncbi:heme/copper-type cytochrome/quinol oxidase, subunit 3 [Brachybacterium faecium DSM 4810]|uniref:cytochrome-c oxidase n=1 Tax=Brachybacterium faecium (strain ATCC 43885 / DSM 4810 / JCM 11609 / LMG 19847 / NBRC 14762 / NCIMB 9860 / 6-10) TaxID=446465 RepID=C7MCE3_BRAFD|nr:heme-copper oxidase subunit III [Brachybacterium faecium]ACU85250.1 heme/copper-type cytochrome/quinol oxidase, subunit 3 [Brachybacterium faecium DSM 4810]